jgi:hypothetical protein
MYSDVLEASSAGGGGMNLQKAQKKTTHKRKEKQTCREFNTPKYCIRGCRHFWLWRNLAEQGNSHRCHACKSPGVLKAPHAFPTVCSATPWSTCSHLFAAQTFAPRCFKFTSKACIPFQPLYLVQWVAHTPIILGHFPNQSSSSWTFSFILFQCLYQAHSPCTMLGISKTWFC